MHKFIRYKMVGRVAGRFTADNEIRTQTIIRNCGSRLRYKSLKSKQIEAIADFVTGKDTFVAL